MTFLVGRVSRKFSPGIPNLFLFPNDNACIFYIVLHIFCYSFFFLKYFNLLFIKVYCILDQKENQQEDPKAHIS